jgi:hypothetical protein
MMKEMKKVVKVVLKLREMVNRCKKLKKVYLNGISNEFKEVITQTGLLEEVEVDVYVMKN